MRAISGIVSVVLLLGCREPADEAMAARYEAVFLAPHPQGDSAFARLPAEKQVDAFVLGVTYYKPARIDLAWKLARRGATAIPHVVRRLRTEESDFVRWQLLEVLEIMSCSYGVAVRDDGDASSVAEEAVASMKSYRQEAGNALRGIGGHCESSATNQ